MQTSLASRCIRTRQGAHPLVRSVFRNERRPVATDSGKHVCTAEKDARKWDESAISMIDKYMGTSSKSRTPAKTDSPAGREPLGNGVLILLALNFGLFAADKLLHLSWIPHLYLWGKTANWWQFVTSAFCHANFHHLSTNMFMLYVFGKTVEDEEGAFGVIFSYLFCAIGGCLASYFLMPKATLLGASGACFGLFVISALIKMKFSFRRLLELAAITPFVYEQISSNVAAQMSGGIGNISHVGHLGGAAAGLLLVGVLSLLPADN